MSDIFKPVSREEKLLERIAEAAENLAGGGGGGGDDSVHVMPYPPTSDDVSAARVAFDAGKIVFYVDSTSVYVAVQKDYANLVFVRLSWAVGFGELIYAKQEFNHSGTITRTEMHYVPTFEGASTGNVAVVGEHGPEYVNLITKISNDTEYVVTQGADDNLAIVQYVIAQAKANSGAAKLSIPSVLETAWADFLSLILKTKEVGMVVVQGSTTSVSFKVLAVSDGGAITVALPVLFDGSTYDEGFIVFEPDALTCIVRTHSPVTVPFPS